ncbi:MAG: SusC/RagA family TonB-linked outer membrane protein [Cyclobacteriaceae bacterium]|nr:SusC/RagA family TonB-linked outer membrane protein [Cyclobacteriaceae bacterium]
MKRLLLLGLMALLLSSSQLLAQERTVSGRVTSTEDGSSLPGVNVVLKGTAVGTATDADGRYSISVPQSGGSLVFSFIGLQSKEVEVGGRNVVDVSLSLDVTQLSEVVVTAIGIQKEKKALGYSVENVKSDKLQQVAELDPLRALQGKIAGVNIAGSSGAPGSATRITIRGNSSLLGNNQPLFVVDGIPYDNSNNGPYAGGGQLSNGAAYSSRIADLDPNNIESMTVLKGAAAAALYGTRAANGVVVVTTKTGSTQSSRKGLEVTYGMTYAQEDIANLPVFQNTYGTGTRFIYQQANGSWGAPFIGTKPYATTATIPHWYNGIVGMEQFWNTQVPYQAYPDNVEKLFRTGSVLDNSISVSGGNEKSSLSVTASHSAQEGFVPNTSFTRTNISVGGRTYLANKLVVGGNVAYTKTSQEAVQSGVGSSGSNNPSAFARALYMGRNWDVHGQPFSNPLDGGSEFMVGRGQADNPLWSYRNAGTTSDVDRIAAVLDLGYDINDWINLTYKIGINSYSQRDLDFLRPGSTGPAGNAGIGRIVTGTNNYEEIESTFLANFNPNLGIQDVSLRATLGHNVNQRTRTDQYYQGLGYVIFDIDDIDNTNAVTPQGGGYSQRRLVGVFADLLFGYKDWAYLTVTGRNDWSSTLPKGGNSFFYPSVTLSVIASDALGISSNALNFLKFRGGYAEVGNDTNPYQLRPIFNINPFGTFPFTGTPSASLSNTERDANLKPERTKEVELGLDAKLFNNKIDLALTVYDRRTTDQIAPVSLPTSTGFSTSFTNFGEVSNKGIEIGLGITPVSLSNSFVWNIYGTFTHNRNVIESLTPGIDQITLGGGFGITSVHVAGQEYGLIRGTVAARDDEGNLLINPANGELFALPTPAIIGNPNPDFLVGLTNTFTFKGFSLNAVFDWRQGGDLWSNTVLSLIGRGVTKDTEDREINSVIPGVYGNGSTFEPIRDSEGNKIPNTTMVEENGLWFGSTFAINGVNEWSVWDATTFRLREVTLGYQFPKDLLSKTPFGSATLSLTGRNLWYIAPNFPKYTNFDPEVNQFGNSNTQGIEWSATPTTKRYAVSLRLTF